MAKIKVSKILFLLTIEITTLCISVNGGYLGCYKENFPQRHFIVNPGALGKSPLTPQICYTLCGGLKPGYGYAALGFGRFCFCSNSSPDPHLLKDGTDLKCSLSCPGDPSQKCGSAAYVSVYSTPIAVELTVSATPKTVPSGNNVVLTTSAQPSDIGFDLRIDFDDFAGRTEYAENGTNVLQRMYHQAGEYEIRSYFTDVDNMLPDVETTTSVVVESIPDGVSIDCLDTMATYEDDVCFITVTRGTNMNLEISYTDGNPGASKVENLQIADCTEYSIGNFVQEHTLTPLATYTSATSTNGLIIHHGNPAQYSGFLVGFEYYGVSTGALDLYVYRPNCGGQVYCYDTNTCQSTCGITCGVEGYCMASGSCCGFPISRSQSLLSSYTLVHTISVSITPGYGYVQAPPDIDIEPGDVIAHDGKVTPLIANSVPDVPIGTVYDQYCSGHIAPPSIGSADCSSTTEVHQLKAIYAETSEIVYPLEFTMPGIVTFMAKLTNLNFPNTAISITADITVLEGVNAAILNVPVYVARNTPTSFSVESYTGSPANVTWNFGPTSYDGTNLNTVSHTFTALGSHNLTVNISNAVSYKFNFTTIYVEELITGLVVNAPTGYVEVGVVTNVNFNMATGSDYICDFEFLCEDGSVESVQITEADGLNFDHTFNTAGDVTISVKCANNLDPAQTTESIRAVERLMNVALTPEGAVVDEPFNFLLTWTSGTDVILDFFEYDGLSVSMTVDESLREAISVLERTETVTSVHTVSYQLTNPLGPVLVASTNFTIEIEIRNAFIDCTFPNESPAVSGSPYRIIPLNTDVECTVSMDAGTGVAIFIDYNDGFNDTLAASPMEPWASAEPGFGFPITHTFATAGYYQMAVTVSNAFNGDAETYPIAVMVGVENSVMNSVVSTVRFDPPAVLHFDFSITGPDPNDARCYIDWGDNNNDEYYPCDLTDVFTHTYMDKDGTLTLTYRLENLVSTKEDTIPVYIVTPIIGMECYTSEIAGIPGEPIDLVFKSWRGPPPDELNITYICDTSVPGVKSTKPRQYKSPDGEDTDSCTYSSTGPVTMAIQAVSLMEDMTCYHDFEILYPVTEDFDVFVPAAPMDSEFNTACALDYNIVYNGLPFPDDAEIVIDHDDNSTWGPFQFNSASLTHHYDYFAEGHYISKIRIFNNASEVTRNILTGCYAAFSAISIDVKRTPSLPLGSSDDWGFGVSRDIFRGDEPIRIYPYFTTGTFVWWEVSAVSTNHTYSCNHTDRGVITLNIEEYGVYTITVTARNPLHASLPATEIVEIMRPVDNITIMEEQQTGANEDKYFDVSMASYGTGMCVAVNFDDGEVELYGDPITCSNTFAAEDHFPGASFKNGTKTDVSQAFTLQHRYTSEGTYVMDIYAWNSISDASADFQFAISGLDCSAPHLDIRYRCRDFRLPMAFFSSRRTKITGLTDIACPNTLRNTKLWTLFRVNQTTNTILEQVDIEEVPSSVNSELAFDPWFLSYGVYLLHYTVTMLTPSVNGSVFSSMAETYIEIVPSPLVAELFQNSMSLITVGSNELLTLAPIDHSYDPDVNRDKGEVDTFDSYSIACRDVTQNETFPEETTEVTPKNVSDLLPSHVNTGGCFQSGAGWFKNFDGSVSFLTSILQPDHLYEFKVIVRKAAGGKNREATVFGQVHVISGSPPSFNIDFTIPLILKTSSKGKFFNPNNQLGMLANLTKPCPAWSVHWEMFAYDHNFCGELFNCWRNLSYLTRYIEGAQSGELTIHTEVFKHYEDVDLFQLRLTGTDDVTSVSGVRIMNLTRNRPPEGGNCTFSPTNGTAMRTNFTIECPNFTDKEDHEIVGYKIICNTADGIGTVVDDPYPYWENKMLPVGDPDDDYVLRCNVTVTDELGAEGTYTIPEVTVEMMSLDDFRQMLKDMAKSTSDMMDMIEAVANLAETASIVTSMASMVHQLSENDENEAYAGMGTFLSFTSTGLGSTAHRVSPFTQVENDSEKQKEFERVRDRTAQLFTQVVDTLGNVTVESPAETNLLASALSEVCASKGHLTRNVQSKLTDLLEKCQDNVLTHEEEMSVEEVESISQNIMDCCANIGESAAKSADMPTDTDRDTQSIRVQNFDVNLDSDRDDVKAGTYTNDEDALREGKKIYNKEVQTAFTAEIINQCENIQETFVEILARKQPKSPTPIKMSTPSFAAEIYKNDAKSLVNRSVHVGGCSVDIPPDMFSPEDEENTYLLSVTTRAAPQIVLPPHSSVSPYTRTISVTFKDATTGEKTKFKLTTPMTLAISQDPNAPKINMSNLPLANPEIPANRREEVFFYHQTEVFNEWAAIRIQFRPTNISEGIQLLVLVNYIDKPEIDETKSKVVHLCNIPSDTSLTGTFGSATEVDPYICFVPAETVADKTGIYSIAVRQLLPHELNMYKKISDLPGSVPTEWKESKLFTTDYTSNAVELTCRYFDEGSSIPKTEGVRPNILSSEESVICDTYHLTTFAGGWAVAPNTIDWNFIFSNADFFKNPTLYITEIVIALAYIIAMIWARRKDRQDLEKLGLAPLLDNDPRDKYYYEIMVSTGMRRGAGTESKVHFILSGEEEETEVRTFEDKKRKIFTRGSTDGFLMSVPESIGGLNYLRIWHDNSGKGRTASWYLNHVVVRDVQTDKKYYFITNRWFAVEEDDGQVDRVIPVAGKEQMTEFSHLFAETATKNLSDGHLWFSVVARPPQSRFTRCQRVSCCLCLLYTSMLANAMFYGTETSDANAFQFGPFALTSEQIFIGVMANLIIFPVNFLLITLFRKSRPRKLRPSRVEEAIKSKPDRTTSMADVNPRVKSSLDYERPGSSFLMETKRPQSSMSRPESSMTAANVDAGNKKKKKRELPWWCTIISWILLWIAVLVSAAFVTFYGIMFQDIKCKKWITSMLISFFTSVFFTQPIKVFLLAIIFSLIIKNPGGDEDDDDEEAPKRLDPDEEYLHDEEDEFGFVTPRRPMYKPKPPDTRALEAARKQRLKEIQMWSVIREILFYAFFLWILLVISYRNVSTNSFNYKHNMQKVFILTNDTNKAFSKVKNANDFWVWAKSGMLRGLRAGPYYNNFPPFYMRGYINDKQSRLMGYAILRQVRTMPNTCKIPSYVQGVIDECNAGYDIADEEDKDYGVGWTSLPANSTREEYKFMSGSSLDSFPYWGEMALYGGGGYVVKLNKAYEDMIAHFDQLENEGWIDKYTRAVFLEFTVYNPSINLFSVSTLLAEFLPSGGVFTSFRFEPCNLLPYMNPAVLFQIICEIIYFAFTVFFVFKEIRFIIKQKKEYFLQFWNLVDLGICAMSVTAIVIYFYRLFCINRLTEYFNETHGNEYMKFQYVGYWSEIFNYIIGFLVFFATLKFLKLLRFNKKISMLSDTLRNSSKDLIHFSIIFNVVFLAFIQVFYLVYMSHLDIFKTFLSSCEAGIVMMMGKFDIYNMLGVNQWLTQIFIFLFVVTVTFIVVNMLLSILNDTFSAVRSDKSKQQNDYEIVDFMLGRFKMWTGIGQDNTTISPSEMEERNKNYRTLEGQIDYFPDQIDRFLASISNMYMGDAKFDDFLQKGMAKKMAMKAQAQQPGMSHPAPRLPGALRISNGARGMTDVQTD